MLRVFMFIFILMTLSMSLVNQGFCDGELDINANLESTIVPNVEQTPVPQQVGSTFSNKLPSLNVDGMIKSFIFVLVLIALFFVFLKWKYGGFRTGKGHRRYIQVVEQSMIGPKKNIYLVKIIDRLLIIGSSNDGMTLLSEIVGAEKDLVFEDLAAPKTGFSSFLKKGRTK